MWIYFVLVVVVGFIFWLMIYPFLVRVAQSSGESVAESYRDLTPLLSESALKLLKTTENSFVDVDEYNRLRSEFNKLRQEYESLRNNYNSLASYIRDLKTPSLKSIIVGLIMLFIGVVMGFHNYFNKYLTVSYLLPIEYWGYILIGVGFSITLLGKIRSKAILEDSGFKAVRTNPFEESSVEEKIKDANIERPRKEKPIFVTKAQTDFLKVLKDGGGELPTKEIAERLGKDSSTVHSLGKKLLKKGLVVSEVRDLKVSPYKVKYWTITEKGEKILEMEE